MSLEIKPRTTTVTLFQGDEYDPIGDKLRQIERAAATSTPRRINDPDPTAEALREYDEYADAAVDRAVKVELMALSRKAYRALLAKHPVRMVAEEDPENPNQPRMVQHEDDEYGFNAETIGDDLIPASIQAAALSTEERQVLMTQVIDGTYLPDREVAEFVDSLADGDFSRLLNAALGLNRSLGPDPKVRLSSHLAPISDEISSSPERLA